MFKRYYQHLLSIYSSHTKFISSILLFFRKRTKSSVTKEDELNLDELISQVKDDNKHDLILCEVPKSYSDLFSQQGDESFTIQISVESTEQVLKRWAIQREFRINGEFHETTKHLSFESWEDFFDIFSEKGKAMIEEFRKS